MEDQVLYTKGGNSTHWNSLSTLYTGCLRQYIQGVSRGIVNILGGGSMDYFE